MAWMYAFLVLAVGASWSCGDGDDDGAEQPDASSPADAREGEIDAATRPKVAGQIFVVEESVTGVAAAGSGSLLLMTFTPSDEAVAPSWEENPGSPFACKVFERTPEQFAYGGVDEGTLQFTMDGGPVYPGCNYVAGEGYRCVSVSGSGGDIQAAGAQQFRISNRAVTFDTDEVGRHVQISGSAEDGNNGLFPIVAADANTITYVNEGGVAETRTPATYRILAGLGPVGQDDPIADDDDITVQLTAGGEEDFESFSYTAENFGDAFTLDTASQEVISNVPADGSEFTISCGGDGGDCGQSFASGINLMTTDGPTEGFPATVLPPPSSKSVLINCIFVTPEVTIPAEASAYIASSGATRILTKYVRVNPNSVPQANGTVDIIIGHAVNGFTNR